MKWAMVTSITDYRRDIYLHLITIHIFKDIELRLNVAEI